MGSRIPGLQNQTKIAAAILATASWLGAASASGATTRVPVVPKWHRFEQVLKSSVDYTNPLQEATLTVRFTSPLGDSYMVCGFWDGAKTWRVRFAPDQPGEWQFQTSCSDTANRGLHGQAGVFLCAAAVGESRFQRHGPVRVARDHRHLEHADGTPFFWLGDTIWNGALESEPRDWDVYAQVRASQHFNVAQWAVAPGGDYKHESALTGFPDRVGVNLEVFRRLDEKVEMLGHAGILSAIEPLLETQTNAMSLQEDQAALFIRYVTARWGADPVVWLATFDGLRSTPPLFARWSRIQRLAFESAHQRPVVVMCGDKTSLTGLLEKEKWIDLFGFKPVLFMTSNSLQVTFRGAPMHMATNGPPWNECARPRLVYTPYENARTPNPRANFNSYFDDTHLLVSTPDRGYLPDPPTRFTADDVRRAAYWGLLMTSPAGVSYGGEGVVHWDPARDADEKTPGANFPMWHKALFMPGAKQMSLLEKFFSSIEFWRLEPRPGAVAKQPGDSELKREVLAAGTEAKDLLLVYVPEDRTLELYLESMPASPTVTWFNPRTGRTSPAVAVVVGRTCQFPTPEPGDWLLIIKAGK